MAELGDIVRYKDYDGFMRDAVLVRRDLDGESSWLIDTSDAGYYKTGLMAYEGDVQYFTDKVIGKMDLQTMCRAFNARHIPDSRIHDVHSRVHIVRTAINDKIEARREAQLAYRRDTTALDLSLAEAIRKIQEDAAKEIEMLLQEKLEEKDQIHHIHHAVAVELGREINKLENELNELGA